ncbi:copia protein [Tanacetum coccineum]|uniref:Copia protein n=1 Tax=Tanacetum coccineum TaxID=301880 RepID=A0ABQ5G8E3_9ASTR
MKTTMSSDTKLTKDKECESVDSTKYRGMIGSLLYLMASRLDIMFSVCLCARFQEAPKTSHLEAVKRIFRYIKGTTHLGLWYPKGTDIETVVYADFDHAGDYVDRKSTSGICTFVGCCLTSWFSKKQTTLAISTTEAEYVSAGKACQQALWMKQALIDYDVRLDDIPIMCDNKGAIDLSKNPVQHSRTKHIEIRHHFLRDNVQKGHISIEKVPSADNIADILTKPLKRESFNYLQRGDDVTIIKLCCRDLSSDGVWNLATASRRGRLKILLLLANEGFSNVKIAYLGGMWVLIELPTPIAKDNLLKHVGVASWFNCLSNAKSDFVIQNGVMFGYEECKDDFFARKRICIKTKQEDNVLEKFKIIVKGKVFVVRAKELFTWFQRIFHRWPGEMGYLSRMSMIRGSRMNHVGVLVFKKNSTEHLHSEALRKDLKNREGDSILEVLEEMIKETKMENISNMDVKFLWGNSNFDFIFSEALGNSGGILCAWDHNVFCKEHHIKSDNFVALYGTWISNQMKILMISIYAPQAGSYKRVLWSYLELLVNRWNGESIVMGDFNEFRRMEERWGSTFNAYGAGRV